MRSTKDIIKDWILKRIGVRLSITHHGHRFGERDLKEGFVVWAQECRGCGQVAPPDDLRYTIEEYPLS